MNSSTAVVTVFRRYAVFSGRSGRAEFWWFFLFSAVVSVITNALDVSLFRSLMTEQESGFALTGGPVSAIFGLVTLLPFLAVSARRFHDTGRSGWWTLVWLIPVVGWIAAVVMCAQQGQPATNEYGPPVPLPTSAPTAPVDHA